MIFIKFAANDEKTVNVETDHDDTERHKEQY